MNDNNNVLSQVFVRRSSCFSLLLSCSRHFLKCFITEQSTSMAFLFDKAVLTFAKKYASICKKMFFFFKLHVLNSAGFKLMA